LAAREGVDGGLCRAQQLVGFWGGGPMLRWSSGCWVAETLTSLSLSTSRRVGDEIVLDVGCQCHVGATV
jgi:hypothetical protein